ncbi:carboxymuconolactone decarboxylase family protein [Paraglaciecola sp.]|uniref:carboxymuconolactone decarboxylase family protein n=1 Tax=Paraglaciecola sp. TaxID=1920173 RepID=UPI0030F3F7B4
MQERIKQAHVFTLQPKLAANLVDLGNAAAASLDKLLVHLVKLRASQLNNCAFCQRMHANEARHDGEQQQRLDVLAAWQEVSVFSAAEKAALRWTECLTLLSSQKIDEQAFQALNKHFSQQQIIDLTVTIATINSWNRIAAGFNFTPNFGG